VEPSQRHARQIFEDISHVHFGLLDAAGPCRNSSRCSRMCEGGAVALGRICNRGRASTASCVNKPNLWLLGGAQKMQRSSQWMASAICTGGRFSLQMRPMTGASKEKEESMKTLVRIVAVVAIAAAFAFSVNADDGTKTPKGKGPVVVPGENAVMTCPKCKNDYAVKVTKPSKGTEPEKAIIATHLCEKCGTKLVTKGDGKAKTEVAVHTCSGCK
jgi:hypothetical protein